MIKFKKYSNKESFRQYEDMPDRDILRLLRAGKADADNAFKYIYQKYSSRILSYCIRILNNRHNAEDIFQETFVRFYQKAREDSQNCSIIGFLVTVARNLCIDHLRKKSQYVSLQEFYSSVSEEYANHKEEKYALINMALENLDFQYKEPLVLRVYEGYSYEEIASIFEITPENARKRVFRAKLKLKEILEPHIKEYSE